MQDPLPHQHLVRVYNKKEMISPKNKHILLVDDDASLRASLRVCLEAVGYQCIEGNDGFEACERLKGQHSVDLIVIDHQMPRLKGLELIKVLKSQEHTKALPIIFIVAN